MEFLNLFGLLVSQKIWKKKLTTIFQKTATLNLFPILERKIDFVRSKVSERILLRPTFIVLVEDEIKVFIDSVEQTKKILEEIKARIMGIRKTV